MHTRLRRRRLMQQPASRSGAHKALSLKHKVAASLADAPVRHAPVAPGRDASSFGPGRTAAPLEARSATSSLRHNRCVTLPTWPPPLRPRLACPQRRVEELEAELAGLRASLAAGRGGAAGVVSSLFALPTKEDVLAGAQGGKEEGLVRARKQSGRAWGRPWGRAEAPQGREGRQEGPLEQHGCAAGRQQHLSAYGRRICVRACGVLCRAPGLGLEMWKDDRLRWKSEDAEAPPAAATPARPARSAAATAGRARGGVAGAISLRVWLLIGYLLVRRGRGTLCARAASTGNSSGMADRWASRSDSSACLFIADVAHCGHGQLHGAGARCGQPVRWRRGAQGGHWGVWSDAGRRPGSSAPACLPDVRAVAPPAAGALELACRLQRVVLRTRAQGG